MRTVWFCEQDPFCQRVLAKHWPGVPVHPDVRALVADTGGERRRQDVRGAHGDEAADEGRAAQRADEPDGGREGAGEGPVVPVPVPYVDVLCGGFPCQDISVAGRGEGIDGARSGLWAEYARLIRELRPRYVVVENVAALLARGMERVLGDLAACGYDAEWDCIPASAVGAPHRRDRVWLVAYPARDLPAGTTPTGAEWERTRASSERTGDVGYPNGSGLEGHRGHDERPGERAAGASGAQPLRESRLRLGHRLRLPAGRTGPRGHGHRGDPFQGRRVA
jgi:site-specific DNA-cytosine methylase